MTPSPGAEAPNRTSGGLDYRQAVVVVVMAAALGVGLYLVQPTKSVAPAAARPAPTPVFATKVAQGRWLYAQTGCPACHGVEGCGGIPNPNYVGDTVPQLNLLAERMMLFEPEDAQIVVAKLEAGEQLEAAPANPPFPTYAGFLAQYGAVRGVIQNGSHPGKKDPNGPEPPLQMPSWRATLDSAKMDAIIAYLITEFPWDEPGEADQAAEEEPTGADEPTAEPTDADGSTAEPTSAGVPRGAP